MKPCIRCERHILPADVDCPFCGTAQSCAATSSEAPGWGARVWLLAGALGVVACGTTSSGPGAGDTSSESGAPSSSGPETTVATSETTIGTTTIGTTDAMTESASTSTDDEGDLEGAFYALPADAGSSSPIECDIWGNDCAKGEKCAAYASRGSSVYDGARCIPVDADPADVGEPCTVEGDPLSGVDNCGRGGFCSDIAPDTGVGVCFALCEGSEVAPICTDATTACAVFEPVLAICLPACDILDDMCLDGEVCMTVGREDVCVPA